MAQEEIGAVGHQKVAQVVRILGDVLQEVAEDRIRHAGVAVVVAGMIVIHHAFYDVVKELLAHFLQKAVLRLEMGVKRAAADVRTVDDVLDGNLRVRLL